MARLVVRPMLLVPALLSLAWVAVTVLGLRSLDLWGLSLLWGTLTFALVGTTTLVWRMAESDDYSSHFYGRIIWRSLGLSVLISAVGNTYTFNIYVELLLVPWLAALGFLLGLSQASEQYAQLRRPLQVVISATALVMLFRAIMGTIDHYHGFLSIHTVQSLILLFALTLAYVPYLLMLRVWMTYQSAFVPLHVGVTKTLRLRLYAQIQIALKFRLDLARVGRFRTTAATQLRDCTTREAVKEVLEKYDRPTA